MLTIIVGTSVVSMILVYMRPNHWLSTASGGQLVPQWAGVLVYFQGLGLIDGGKAKP